MEDLERLSKMVQQYKRGEEWYENFPIECDISLNMQGNHDTWKVIPKDKTIAQNFRGRGASLDEALADFRLSLKNYIWRCFANGGLVCFGNGDVEK